MKYFKRVDFKCKGTNCDGRGGNCGMDTVDYELVDILDELRDYFDEEVYINCGNRCLHHNIEVGGEDASMHMVSKAADIRVHNHRPAEVADYLQLRYNGKYGIGRYNTFTHIDTRSTMARWDNRSK